MASGEHWILLDDDVRCWNRWRAENPEIYPDLRDLSLSRRQLASANLSRCNLSGAHLNHTNLKNCDLFRANLNGASLQGADLTGANCCEMEAAGANLSAASFKAAQITNANLTGAHLTDVSFEAADLSGSNLSRSNLFQATLRSANLTNSQMVWSNLTRVDLTGADLQACDLTGASFIEADLSDAVLKFANLRYARFVDCRLERTNVSNCRIYGVSVWNVTSENAIQSDLVITPPGEATITVDNFEVAQFVYLLLNSGNVRRAIDTISSKVVLILGRFTHERALVLRDIQQLLRDQGYLPLLFDFAGPSSRDLTETISTLAHLARFVLADLTDARSIPQELMAIVPSLPSVPIKPLLLESQQAYGMFEHFKRYPWVLETLIYRDSAHLLKTLKESVIQNVESMAAANMKTR
jgi:uncharacterized protein YjbI with pentapeptide repeats